LFQHVLFDAAIGTLQSAVFAFQLTFTFPEHFGNQLFLTDLVQFEQTSGGTSAGLAENRNDLPVFKFMLNMPPGSHVPGFFLNPQRKQHVGIFPEDVINL